jgi:ribosomal protein S18 acetylase RimI-like enzyme
MHTLRNRVTMNCQIRLAQLSDAQEIAILSKELGYPATTAEISDRLELLLPNPMHLVLVAEATDNSSLLGWLASERRITLESGVRFEIVGLVVSERARRQGIGRALLEASERWVVGHSGSNVNVRSNILRPESHGFYESLGYVRKKTQHAYYKNLAV